MIYLLYPFFFFGLAKGALLFDEDLMVMVSFLVVFSLLRRALTPSLKAFLLDRKVLIQEEFSFFILERQRNQLHYLDLCAEEVLSLVDLALWGTSLWDSLSFELLDTLASSSSLWVQEYFWTLCWQNLALEQEEL